jgi:hypothetical protein
MLAPALSLELHLCDAVAEVPSRKKPSAIVVRFGPHDAGVHDARVCEACLQEEVWGRILKVLARERPGAVAAAFEGCGL